MNEEILLIFFIRSIIAVGWMLSCRKMFIVLEVAPLIDVELVKPHWAYSKPFMAISGCPKLNFIPFTIIQRNNPTVPDHPSKSFTSFPFHTPKTTKKPHQIKITQSHPVLPTPPLQNHKLKRK